MRGIGFELSLEEKIWISLALFLALNRFFTRVCETSTQTHA